MPRRKKTVKPEDIFKTVYQFKVTLLGIEPSIWRRFIIPSEFDLYLLHGALQGVMGWTNSHLHFFEIGEKKYTALSLLDDDLWEPMDEEMDVALPDAGLKKGSRFRYIYDLGDDWQHDVEVEDVRAAKPDEIVMACLDGARACPPEDCGGPPGYQELLAALRNAAHARHKELTQWIGKRFDPERFNPDERTKAMLRSPSGAEPGGDVSLQ